MQDVGQWVLHSCCRKIKEWEDAGLLQVPQTVAVNVSGIEIASPDFVSRINRTLDETGANPLLLGIELTEGSLVSTNLDIVGKMKTVQRLGVKFSVDDFGTGYSSLNYLKSLPLHTLKIDRSFVNDINSLEENVVLVDTIIMMARNLGLEVIAEGVESELEVRYLDSKGCHVYQGFYFSCPLREEPLAELLKAGRVKIEGNPHPVVKPV